MLGSLTGVSRVLGFIRDLVIAAAFGTSVAAEAFVVSFKLPNLLRDLVGEGAANAAFVPVLTECKEKKPEDFWGLVSTLFLIMTVILAALSVLGVLFTPWIIRLIAPGFVAAADPEKFPLTVQLTRTIFPYIFLIGLSALAMGVLNTLKEFTASALGPILLNISMIFFGFFFEKTYGPMALVIGVLCGGVLQLACQIPSLLKRGFKLTPPDFTHSAVAKIGKLLIPRAFGSALYHINVFVDTILASFEKIVGAGGQSALYYSNRLFQLPLAIFGVAMAQALLPTFSAQMVREDLKGFKETFSFAVRSLMVAVVPASVGLIALSEPIIRIIFERGKFDAYSTAITSSALYFYAFGLLSCCFIKIFVNAFYAMHDTKTPVKITFVSLALNIVFCLVLMKPLKIGGLALASSLSATVNMLLLYKALRRKLGGLDEERILKTFLKIAVAAVLMGFAALAYNTFILDAQFASRRLVQAAYLFGGIFLSILVYFGLAFLLRIEETKALFSWRPRSPRT